MKRKNSITVYLTVLFVILFALGGADAAPPAKPTKTAKPAKAAGKAKPGASMQVAALPASATPAGAYRYSPAGKSDPFRPFMETDIVKIQAARKAAEKAQVSSVTTPLSPLQRIEIEQFNLIGIAGTNEKRVAMVEEKITKKYYPIIQGTYIGQNNGRVVEIRASSIVVQEGAGGKRTTIKLYKDEEEKP